MLKYLKICISLLFLTLILTISSCSKKHTAINLEGQAHENIGDSNNEQGQGIIIDKKKSVEKQEEQQEVIEQPKNTYIKLPRNKEVTFLNKSFVKSQDTENLPVLDSINDIYVINTIPIDYTALEYYNRYFDKFKLVGFSIVYVDKQLKTKNIKYIAQKYGANIVIYKCTYNFKVDKYVVEILYLNGNLTDNTLFFNRTASEAIPVEVTLNDLEKKVKNKSRYDSLRKALGVRDKEGYNKNVISNNNSLLDPSINTIDTNIANIEINEANNLSEVKLNENIQEKAKLNDIEKLENRINNIVGLWMDSYDKSIVSIQEISRSNILKNNDKTFVESSVVKYYGAYIILKDEKSIEKYNKDRTINTSNIFQWKNEDLKFQFNSSGKNGIYLNKNKMPELAFICVYPIKGILMVTMSTGETRYYIPLGLDVDPKFVKGLYKNLPSHIPPMNQKVTGASHYGTGLYGWIISGGLILLGLGLLSIF